MELIFILLPFCLVLAAISVGFFFWAVKSGQYDDTTTPAIRMLFDDEPVKKTETSNNAEKASTTMKPSSPSTTGENT